MNYLFTSLLTFTLVLSLASCGEDSSIIISEGSDSDTTSTIPAAPDQPGDWVFIPANTGGMGLNAFYVMKYEAKAWNDINADGEIDVGEVDSNGRSVNTASHIPISFADNQPWREISANDSAAECESLGVKYHLISNPEWMAIARDIEDVNSNWTGGNVGSGCLFRGNSGDTICGYNSATDPDSGAGRNVRAKHTLSTGDEIFDLAGNLSEWTDWDGSSAGFQTGPTSCATGWTNLTAVNCGALSSDDYDTANGTYTADQGVGRFYGGAGGASARGGLYFYSSQCGVFSLSFDVLPTSTNQGYGFRCVYRP